MRNDPVFLADSGTVLWSTFCRPTWTALVKGTLIERFGLRKIFKINNVYLF